MNPKTAKELRLILHPLLAISGLMLLFLLVCQSASSFQLYRVGLADSPLYLNWLLWTAGSAFLASRIFAAEFQYRTLGLWLGQPSLRSEFWRRKFAVLVPAILLLTASYWISTGLFGSDDAGFRFNQEILSQKVHWMLELGLAALLISISTAPFWATIAKSVVGTTALVLASQYITGMLLLRWIGADSLDFPPGHLGILAGAVVLCAAAFLFAAWRRLQHLEAVDHPGLLAGSDERRDTDRKSPAALTFLRSRPRGAWRNLVLKELHFHRPTLVFAVLFLVSVTVLGLLDAGFRSPENVETMDVLRALPFFVYTVGIALFSGAASFSEEASLGTHLWNLGLPVDRRVAFLIRLGVSATMFLLFAVLLPTVTYLTYARLQPDVALLWTSYLNVFSGIMLVIPWASIGVFLLSFWISSLVPDLVRCGLLSLGTLLVSILILGFNLSRTSSLPSQAFDQSLIFHRLASAGTFFHLNHLPLLSRFSLPPGFFYAWTLLCFVFAALGLLSLSYWNSRRIRNSGFVLTSQILGIVIALTFISFGYGAVANLPKRVYNAQRSDEIGFGRQLRSGISILLEGKPIAQSGDEQTFTWEELLATGSLTDPYLAEIPEAPRTLTVKRTNLTAAGNRPGGTPIINYSVIFTPSLQVERFSATTLQEEVFIYSRSTLIFQEAQEGSPPKLINFWFSPAPR